MFVPSRLTLATITWFIRDSLVNRIGCVILSLIPGVQRLQYIRPSIGFCFGKPRWTMDSKAFAR
jgi:hypothetical protein